MKCDEVYRKLFFHTRRGGGIISMPTVRFELALNLVHHIPVNYKSGMGLAFSFNIHQK
jgi:hypothetical protein